MYGEAGTEDIYDSFATRVRVRDKQDLCYNEDIYQTIFPPKQPRLSLADISFGGTGKKNLKNFSSYWSTIYVDNEHKQVFYANF